MVFYDLGFGGGGMQYSHFAFSLEDVYIPVVGPHLGVSQKKLLLRVGIIVCKLFMLTHRL